MNDNKARQCHSHVPTAALALPGHTTTDHSAKCGSEKMLSALYLLDSPASAVPHDGCQLDLPHFESHFQARFFTYFIQSWAIF